MPTDEVVSVAVASTTPSRSGPLSWGQRWMWAYFEETSVHRNAANTPCRLHLPDGLGTERVLTTLKMLVARHESLRTVYRRNDRGELAQFAMERGEVRVTVHEATAGAEGISTVVEELGRQLCAVDFDVAEEWPVRAGVVTVAGAPRGVVIVVDHMAIDAWSMALLGAEFEAMVNAAEGIWENILPPVRHHPIDQATNEQDSHAVQVGGRALRHWEKQLRSISPRLPRRRTRKDRPAAVHHDSVMTSGALVGALATLSSRYKTSWANVLLATTAVLLSTHLDQDQSLIQVISSNRYQPQTRACVGTFIQSGLVVVDTPRDRAFGAIVAATATAAFHAYRFGSYDPYLLAELRREICGEPGMEPDFSYYFNYLDYEQFDYQALADEGNQAQNQAQTKITAPVSRTVRNVTLFSNFEPKRDCMSVQLIADSTIIHIGSFFRAMESVLAEAVLVDDLDVEGMSRVSGLDRGAANHRTLGTDLEVTR